MFTKYFLLFLLGDGEFTTTVIRGPTNRVNRKTLFGISHNDEVIIGAPISGKSDSGREAHDEDVVYTAIPVPPKYKNWGEPPTNDNGERAIMSSIVQWSAISHTGSGKIGYGSKYYI